MVTTATDSRQKVIALIERLKSDPRGAKLLSQRELCAINAQLGRGYISGKFVATIGIGGHLLLLEVTASRVRPLAGSRILPFCEVLQNHGWLTCSRPRFLRAVNIARMSLFAH